jgi:hypothetical protein
MNRSRFLLTIVCVVGASGLGRSDVKDRVPLFNGKDLEAAWRKAPIQEIKSK